jgi:phosphoglycolate phosphatase
MIRPDALVFDLDGTLIDSRRDITTAINRMRADLGLPPLALEQVVTMVGEGARLLVERALGPGFTPDRIDEALPRYLGYYWEVCLEATKPYPGIEAMLAALAGRYPLALLSNKGEALSHRVLDGLGLTSHFREVLGGDSLPTRKPDPAGLRVLAGRLGVPVARLLLVGDTWIDAATARNAGCAFALVAWGFPRPPKLDGLQADLEVEKAEELTAALV